MRFLVFWGTAPKASGFFGITVMQIRNHTNICPCLVLPWLPTVLPESWETTAKCFMNFRWWLLLLCTMNEINDMLAIGKKEDKGIRRRTSAWSADLLGREWLRDSCQCCYYSVEISRCENRKCTVPFKGSQPRALLNLSSWLVLHW